MFSADEIASLMAASGPSPAAQLAQTKFRMRLAEAWRIQPGMRLLEIGSGQGDTTAVLANAVGESGHVLAVDIADPGYGAPVNVGDSCAHLARGPLGGRIEFRLSFDVLESQFSADSFDAIVLAHCTWYFDSLDRLRQTLAHIRPWSRRLLLSEWDLMPQKMTQLGHLLAVLTQGQVEAYKKASESNIRTPYSRETLREMLAQSGWEIESEALVETAELDDGRWEVEACLDFAVEDAEAHRLPPRLLDQVKSQVDLLRRLTEEGRPEPLPAYAIIAVRG